ncbi:hypothetical protein CRG98_048058 [Punica granatum]|uniref:Uncharacterized protein n=1 Tax=Punica granatum TaxID=22663 RepID=A0A2I0HIL8_PUNGR|nr:hypothetical protein CRG98_048058 [Punica granatum]
MVERYKISKPKDLQASAGTDNTDKPDLQQLKETASMLTKKLEFLEASKRLIMVLQETAVGGSRLMREQEVGTDREAAREKLKKNQKKEGNEAIKGKQEITPGGAVDQNSNVETQSSRKSKVDCLEGT